MKEAGLSHPTFFEFLFGMAVLAFAESGVEYAVLETGLGGRLDATNAVESPAASVITSIGFVMNSISEIRWRRSHLKKRALSSLMFPYIMRRRRRKRFGN